MPDPTPQNDGFPKSEWTPPDTGLQLAPGGAAAARAMGLHVPEPTPAPTAPVAPAPPAPSRPKARLAPRPGLEERVAFDFPIEFDGRTYEGVVVRQLTIGTLAAWMEERGDAPATGAVFRYPIYFDDAGDVMPDEVLDACVMVDHAKVVKASERFLPPASLGGAG